MKHGKVILQFSGIQYVMEETKSNILILPHLPVKIVKTTVSYARKGIIAFNVIHQVNCTIIYVLI